jgi:hypothetical protein
MTFGYPIGVVIYIMILPIEPFKMAVSPEAKPKVPDWG